MNPLTQIPRQDDEGEDEEEDEDLPQIIAVGKALNAWSEVQKYTTSAKKKKLSDDPNARQITLWAAALVRLSKDASEMRHDGAMAKSVFGEFDQFLKMQRVTYLEVEEENEDEDQEESQYRGRTTE